MKIANFLMAGAVALLMTSCGGVMSLDEAKKINSVEDGKYTTEQKELMIKNSIELLNEREYDTDFEAEFIADQTVELEVAEEWAKEDSKLKELVDEFKEAEQADTEKYKEYLREKIEWAKENGLEKIAERAENQLKNIK